MSDWKAKRFWKTATPVRRDAGWAVDLDGRAVKTPAKAALIVPTERMAQAITAEWDAQVDLIDPRTMPVTRGANAAIDKVSIMIEEVVDELSSYGGTDLLCYRAAAPVELQSLQADKWDPWLIWSAQALDAPLVTNTGVMHIEQPAESLVRLRGEVACLDAFSLAGLHDLVALSGSLVLALAVTKGKLAPQEAWDLSRLDEFWQNTQWGEDEDANAVAAIKQTAFLDASRFFEMST